MATLDEIRARGSPVFLTYQLCCASYLVVLALTYGNLIVYNPSFHVEDFYVPALNKALNSTDTTLIFFNLIIQNQMVNVGFRYAAVNLTFSYAANTSTTVVLGTYTVPGFYQGMNKKARRRDVAIVPWKEAAGSKLAEFRLDVATHAKLKNYFWYFKDTTITAAGTVTVDDSGKKQSRDSVDLQSRNNPSAVQVVFWALGFLILIIVGVSFIVFGVLFGFQISGYRPT